MDILDRRDLRTLSSKRDGWHVSIFMPTHRVGPETQQDPIRLKNLLGEAEQRLMKAGLRSSEAEARLEPVSQLVEDGLFWQQQSDSLAIFVSAEEAFHYRIPFDLEELVVVAERFHVKPLLPFLSGDGQFYVLAISKNGVRLLHGTRYSVGEVDLEGIPSSLADALRFDDPERRLQFHTASGPSGGSGGRPAMFYGQGAPSQDEKTDILRYFQRVDEGVRELLAGEQAPLVLVGVDYLLPIYEEANEYPYLVEEGITGNPEDLSNKELHQRVWSLVQPGFREEQKEAVDLFLQLADSDRASEDLVEVVPAAIHGRIETLFVALGQQQWGRFEPETNEVKLHADFEPGEQDLTDLAAIQTLLNGGRVYAVEPAQMPDEAALVAGIFRY
jgi:hypothetical protein